MVLRQPWLGYVLEGAKTMEIRGRKRKPGSVWLGYNGNIYGRANVVDSVLLSETEFRAREPEHLWPVDLDLPYEQCWGLQLADVEKLDAPVTYWRPGSAIGWNIYRTQKEDLPMRSAKGAAKRKTGKKRSLEAGREGEGGASPAGAQSGETGESNVAEP